MHVAFASPNNGSMRQARQPSATRAGQLRCDDGAEFYKGEWIPRNRSWRDTLDVGPLAGVHVHAQVSLFNVPLAYPPTGV
jgi:hypothetical protein